MRAIFILEGPATICSHFKQFGGHFLRLSSNVSRNTRGFEIETWGRDTVQNVRLGRCWCNRMFAGAYCGLQRDHWRTWGRTCALGERLYTDFGKHVHFLVIALLFLRVLIDDNKGCKNVLHFSNKLYLERLRAGNLKFTWPSWPIAGRTEKLTRSPAQHDSFIAHNQKFF